MDLNLILPPKKDASSSRKDCKPALALDRPNCREEQSVQVCRNLCSRRNMDIKIRVTEEILVHNSVQRFIIGLVNYDNVLK